MTHMAAALTRMFTSFGAEMNGYAIICLTVVIIIAVYLILRKLSEAFEE